MNRQITGEVRCGRVGPTGKAPSAFPHPLVGISGAARVGMVSTMPSQPALVEEAVASLVEAWTLMTGRIPEGRLDRLEGVTIPWGDVPLPFFNLCIVDTPCADGDDLRRRLDATLAHVADERHPWMVCLCEEWVPENWRDVIADAGLHFAMPITGMVAERILPPRRTPPTLDLRRVSDDRSRGAVAELSNLAYGLPDGMCDCVAEAAFWLDEVYGYVGSQADEDVTTTTVFAAGGTLYVGLVATHPEHGRKGYAEHVMRHALHEGFEALGLRRSILHATDAGHPVYAAMGFEDTARFDLLSSEPPEEH
jgi:ribosomal protein S18 acetylase RimI-like enzyme